MPTWSSGRKCWLKEGQARRNVKNEHKLNLLRLEDEGRDLKSCSLHFSAHSKKYSNFLSMLVIFLEGHGKNTDLVFHKLEQ